MDYLFIFATFLLAALTARFIIPRILLISIRKRLFDVPDERKIHTQAIPRLGGVSFFPTILFAYALVFAVRLLGGDKFAPTYAQHLLPEMLLFVCGMTMLYLVGIADDLVGVRYRQKFLVQIFCACLFPLAGLCINDLYGLLGIHQLPAFVAVPFTIFTVVFITNAINLIDGIDGLASGLSGVALLIFTGLFIEKGLWSYAMLSAATFGVLVPFFYYNVFGNADRARKIFMGDTGSLTLGYTLCFLAIKYCQYAPSVVISSDDAFFIAFSTLLLPAFDVIRVVLYRLRNGRNPFEPDKNHIHHKLLAIGLTPRRAMVSLVSMACLFCLVNILLVAYVNSTLLLMVDIIVWVALHLWWDYLIKKRKAIDN
ncbi:glycosyl transferase family 4 conserved region [Bacteroides sp. CAG:598]|nr:glycosyl transferase family 4 conserved region [Bacteroides sp. CAG:598]